MGKVRKPGKPLASKVGRRLDEAFKQKVLDFGALREGKDLAEKLMTDRPTEADFEGFHPAHAIYVDVLNKIGILATAVTQLEEMDRISNVINAADEAYMPGGPPMSPVTLSMFNSWSFFDCGVGIERETIGSVVLELGSKMGLPAEFAGVAQKWQDSRFGLYMLEQPAGETAQLRELVTGTRIEAVNPTSYEGTESNIWYVRVLPPPVPKLTDHVIVTTPYEIMAPRTEGWLRFLERTLPKTKLSDTRKAYEHLMKWGLSPTYWLEYVLEAYLNDDPEGIRLMGLPDIAQSRPNSMMNQDEGSTALRKYVESGRIMTGMP